jgi:hypothetical protein
MWGPLDAKVMTDLGRCLPSSATFLAVLSVYRS